MFKIVEHFTVGYFVLINGMTIVSYYLDENMRPVSCLY